MNSKYQAFLLILASIVLILIIYINLPGASLKGIAGKNTEWTLIATGDVMLGRTVMTTSLDMNDPTYPFLKVADRLKTADITFINLENPVVTDCPRYTTGFTFCADPQMTEGLLFAGIDVVTLSNNHIGNFGNRGIEETKQILSSKGIDYTFDNLLVREVNGIKIGFIGLNIVDRKSLVKEELDLIKTSKSQVDYLIVAPHWGYEYQSKASKYQQSMAKEIVDSGADLIIGSHPHWVQNVEYVNGKPVYYSLGNFVFDQMWSEETKKGIAVRFTFEGNKLVKEEHMPIYMSKWAQPEWR